MSTPFNAMMLPLPSVLNTASPEPQATASSVGLCFSGGGSRALTCAMGQLRGLRALGLLDQTFALSSVSGGTWASSLYTYLPASISDDEFLGQIQLDPSKITIWGNDGNALDHLPAHNLGQVPTRLGTLSDLSEILDLKLKYGYPNNDLWQGLIGSQVLSLFGLWTPDAQGFDRRYISWTKAVRDAAIARNPGLTAADFIAVERQRPFLVMNTSLFLSDDASADLVPFEANFSLGVRQFFPPSGAQTGGVGGGLLESFAFTGDYVGEGQPGYVQTTRPARPYSLADIVGSSSAAFAQVAEEQFPALSGLVPRYSYWPVQGRASTPSQVYRFADGGSLENLGLNALLARGLRKLAVFVNTDEKLRKEGNDIVVSSDLPPLFGLQPWVAGKGYVPYAQDPGSGSVRLFRHNQVFDTRDFWPLIQQLWQARQNGQSVLVPQSLSVLPNPWFNVPGGYTVQLLWAYNEFVPNWWNQLSREVQLFIDAESVLDFPMYNTFTQLELSRYLVNALAHLASWNVAADAPAGKSTNKDLFRALYS